MSTRAPAQLLPPAPTHEPTRGRRRRLPLRSLVLALAAGWLVLGALGGYAYVHRYWLYRGFPPPVTPPGVAPGSLQLVRLRSTALGQRREYLVYLPAGYAAAAARRRRFPALYLLHAAPGRPDGFLNAGAIAVRAAVLTARRRMRPMLLVVPFGKTRVLHSDTEWANAGAGRYMDFVMEVVRDVDRRFATLRRRQDRGLAGLSEGAYGALNIALHHLDTFSVVESWSGYFTQTPTGPFAGAAPAVVRANSPTDEVRAKAARIRRLGLRAWLYQGQTDPFDPANLQRFGTQLARAGAEVHVGLFPGGHDWALWRREVPRMLTAASGWFARRPAGRGALARVGRPLPEALRHRILLRRYRRCLVRLRHPPAGRRRPRSCEPPSGPAPGAAAPVRPPRGMAGRLSR